MKAFLEMLKRITSSPYYDQMLRFAAPLKDHFGINHFWYYGITNSGYYSYMGTHAAWSEYCFENRMVDYFPCLRHPDMLGNGVSLMKKTANEGYKNVLKTAWEKFNINFNINLIKKTPEGIEAFGFATEHKHRMSDELLLNELPLLCHFTKAFRERHRDLFQLLADSQVDLSSYLGPQFKENPKNLPLPRQRDLFLKKMGFEAAYALTPREKDVLKYVSSGYPSSYIAEQLCLCRRTVENYLATIKDKLCCTSKVELIQKAQELDSIGYFTSI